jgi:hypothetical protein
MHANPRGRSVIEDAVSAYYSSLSDEESIEHAQWGDFALRDFPTADEYNPAEKSKL